MSSDQETRSKVTVCPSGLETPLALRSDVGELSHSRELDCASWILIHPSKRRSYLMCEFRRVCERKLRMRVLAFLACRVTPSMWEISAQHWQLFKQQKCLVLGLFRGTFGLFFFFFLILNFFRRIILAVNHWESKDLTVTPTSRAYIEREGKPFLKSHGCERWLFMFSSWVCESGGSRLTL